MTIFDATGVQIGEETGGVVGVRSFAPPLSWKPGMVVIVPVIWGNNSAFTAPDASWRFQGSGPHINGSTAEWGVLTHVYTYEEYVQAQAPSSTFKWNFTIGTAGYFAGYARAAVGVDLLSGAPHGITHYFPFSQINAVGQWNIPDYAFTTDAVPIVLGFMRKGTAGTSPINSTLSTGWNKLGQATDVPTSGTPYSVLMAEWPAVRPAGSYAGGFISSGGGTMAVNGAIVLGVKMQVAQAAPVTDGAPISRLELVGGTKTWVPQNTLV